MVRVLSVSRKGLLIMLLLVVCQAGGAVWGGPPDVVQPAGTGKGDGFIENRSLLAAAPVRRRKVFEDGSRRHYVGQAETIIKYYRFNPYNSRTEFVEEKHLDNAVEIFTGLSARR